ncbi:FAD dependent oxidoreductase-domain-containing protein [Podospora didyma]|uniref:FAD dependent oxidoreductase-domain-containing protein n=1 Tax=Podospora didyma TaxID=330526 RepID=A0AAE0U1D2_9PEZI|nr:FAD dependent oxidoreductase-domain-containing protein [Podospora didyma]
MGSVISSLVGAVKGVKAVVAVIREIASDYKDLFARANHTPGLPVPNPTTAFWQDDPPFPELVNIQSEVLPETADIVIVGSGIAAAAIARTILHECQRMGQTRRVVVCEARTLCSGATGRNGGHIKASPHEVFSRHRKLMQPERAAALSRFQLRHLETLVSLCDAEKIHVAECREVETVDLFLDEETFDQAVKEAKETSKWIPEFKTSVWTSSAAQWKFAVNDQVKGAISYKAGALWPYRLVTSIWKQLLDGFPKSLSIETDTAVEEIDVSGTPSDFPYLISTSRGVIRANHVVHATNAFAPHLVQGLKGKTVGVRAQMSSQRPGRDFPDLNGQRSWSIMYGSGFDYVTQRPAVDGVPGHVMLGGGFVQSPKHGLDAVGVYDDSKMDSLTNAHNLGIMPSIFEPNWGPPVDSGTRKVWSGVIGVSADLRPLVGKLDSRLTGRMVKGTGRNTGEWIAAAFIGDGMVWAWLSGTALGVMIMGSQDEQLAAVPGRPGGKLEEWFPAELLPTYDRVKKMDIGDLANVL